MELIRGVDAKVRAAVMSGYSSDPVLARPEEFGFAAVLRKPFRTEELAEVMRAVLPP